MANSYTYAVARIRALEARMLQGTHISRMIEAPDLERAFFVLNETSYAENQIQNPLAYSDLLDAEISKVHSFLKYYAGGDSALQKLWRRYDYANTKILIRAAKIGKENVTLSSYGSVDPEILKTFIFKGEGRIPVWLEKAVANAIVAFEETKAPSDIDLSLDNAYLDDLCKSENIILKTLSKAWREVLHPFDRDSEEKTYSILKATKRHAFGIEPLITFWLAKEFEARMIYRILVAKKHRISADKMNERGRPTYV